MGDRVQEAEFSETVYYRINVINLRDYESPVDLEITEIPDYWNASLNEDQFNLASNSNKIVVLSVRAPREEDSRNRGFSSVAAIGVRANGNLNTTVVGTLTILNGYTDVSRDGRLTHLYSGDEVESFDIITTVGNSSLNFTWTNLTKVGHNVSAFMLFNDASIGYFVNDSKIYMPLLTGNITFYGKGFGGESNKNYTFRGPEEETPKYVTVLNKQHPIVTSAFPDLEYNYTLILDPWNITDPLTSDDSLITFSLSRAGSKQRIKIESLEGEVTVEALENSTILSPSQEVSLIDSEDFTRFRDVERSIITIDSTNSVDVTIESDGKNILDFENTRRIIADGKEIYIYDSFLLPVELVITSENQGNYSIEFSTINDNVIQSFTLNSTYSLSTEDTIVYGEDSLKLKEMEADKFYDLTIVHHNLTSGQFDEFKVTDVPTLDDDVTFEVTNWEELENVDDPPVDFYIGDESIPIHTGMTGEEIMTLFEITHKTESSRLWAWLLPLPIIAIAALAGYQYYFVAAPLKGLVIDGLVVEPSEPIATNPTIFTARIKNIGIERKGKKHDIMVTFYDNFEVVATKTVDTVSESFDHGDIREVSFDWIPQLAGPHMMNVSLDVDNTEVDTDRIEVSVIDRLQRTG